jgi:urease accessory protein
VTTRRLELVPRGGRAAAASPPADTARHAIPGAGRGDVVVSRGADGRSRATRVYATSPLRMLTPVNHGDAAWVYLSSYGGGLVDGDRVSLDVSVEPGATAFLSTQASTKVYRSQHGTASRLEAHVADDALLVFAPDPVVCFAGARYRQWQRITLEPRGSLVLVDWVTSGRRAAGERWQFDEYTAHTEVDAAGRRAVYDTLSLQAAHGPLDARLGRFDVLALVVIAGERLDAHARLVAARVEQTPVVRRAEVVMSAAPLRTGGCAVRIAGPSAEQVGRIIERVLEFVPPLLGDNPWARKW